MKSFEQVKEHWSGIDVSKEFGPYQESVQARLAQRLWDDESLKQALKDRPDAYFEETGFERPHERSVRIVDKTPQQFIFVVPLIPPESEIWHRYEQISNWWMYAHAFHWWMRRDHGSKVDPFLSSLDVQIIGRSWTDMDWRRALLADPRATLERELAAKFDPGLDVQVIEETSDHILVLPDDPASEETGSKAKHLGSLFGMAHTYWQWLVWPRLMRRLDDVEITRMVK